MQILHINLKSIAGDRVELRYFFDNPNQYQPRSLELNEIKESVVDTDSGYQKSSVALRDRLQLISG